MVCIVFCWMCVLNCIGCWVVDVIICWFSLLMRLVLCWVLVIDLIWCVYC